MSTKRVGSIKITSCNDGSRSLGIKEGWCEHLMDYKMRSINAQQTKETKCMKDGVEEPRARCI